MNEFDPTRDTSSSTESLDESTPLDSDPSTGSAESDSGHPEQDTSEEAHLRQELKWYQAATGQFRDVAAMPLDELRQKSRLVERFVENYWTPTEDQKQLLGQLYDIRLQAESRTESTPIESARVAVAQEVYGQTHSEALSLLEQQAQSRPSLFEANENMNRTRRQLAGSDRLCRDLREISGQGQAAAASLLAAEVDLTLARRRHEINQQVFLEVHDHTNQIDDWAERAGLTRDEVDGHLYRYQRSERIELAHRHAAEQVFEPCHITLPGWSLPPERRTGHRLKMNDQNKQRLDDRLGSRPDPEAWGDEYVWVSGRIGDLYDLVDYDKPTGNAHLETSRLNQMMPGWEGRLSDYRRNESRYAVADRFGQSRDAIKSIIDDRSEIAVDQVYQEFNQTRLDEQTQLTGQIPPDLLKLFETEA